MFCDKVTVKIKAGNGGDGLLSFLHEKYKEYGGPDGGDGGRGGDVVLRVGDNLNTLYYFKTHHNLYAENGEKGKKRKSRGKNGESLEINVPPGTVVIDKDGHQIVDMSDTNEFILARGGRGGFGNAHFVSSVRQAPQVAELGEPGEELEVTFELKLIADVGLIGLPNVGKSTFLSVVSAAKPKIADYEFTTLIPNLGVVDSGTFGAESGFIVADIPGLIEGASKGKGLGDDFLRHIERTRVLVHFLDVNRQNIAKDYKTIRKELAEYENKVGEKKLRILSELPEIIVISKIDAILEEDLEKKIKELKKHVSAKVIPISAVAHKNIPELIYEIESRIKEATAKEGKEAPSAPAIKTFTIEDVEDESYFEVEKKDNYYVVSGPKIEKFSLRTDFNNPHSIFRLRDIFKKMGVDKELRRNGAKEGDRVKIAGKELVL